MSFYSSYQTPEVYSYKKREDIERKKGIPGGGIRNLI
jgi:hypothetical protein